MDFRGSVRNAQLLPGLLCHLTPLVSTCGSSTYLNYIYWLSGNKFIHLTFIFHFAVTLFFEKKKVSSANILINYGKFFVWSGVLILVSGVG